MGRLGAPLRIVPGTSRGFFCLGVPSCRRMPGQDGRDGEGVRSRTALRCASQAITISLWQPSALSCIFPLVGPLAIIIRRAKSSTEKGKRRDQTAGRGHFDRSILRCWNFFAGLTAAAWELACIRGMGQAGQDSWSFGNDFSSDKNLSGRVTWILRISSENQDLRSYENTLTWLCKLLFCMD